MIDRGFQRTKVCLNFEFCMQKLLGFKVALIDEPKPSTQEPHVKVVDMLRINVHLLCKIFGCWF